MPEKLLLREVEAHRILISWKSSSSFEDNKYVEKQMNERNRYTLCVNEIQQAAVCQESFVFYENACRLNVRPVKSKRKMQPPTQNEVEAEAFEVVAEKEEPIDIYEPVPSSSSEQSVATSILADNNDVPVAVTVQPISVVTAGYSVHSVFTTSFHRLFICF
ncbi:unnamed protein product [Caenorhabditis angaria]|uniref:Uncharacterized protein n=1 Tax=Caenorhabditis angaria TaxID=860376 RepID=A0A9P1N6Z3_9PELO|nr:unnamed protein product [Caenorhabditis angaria]